MSNDHEQRDLLDTARAAMRARLGQEFRSLHKRRRQRRIAAACLAPAALVVGLVLWNWSGWKRPADSIPPAEQLATATVPSVEKSPLENSTQLVKSKTPSSSAKAAGFQHIEYIELKPGDLPKWLAEAKSDLIVYEVGGRTEVVSERELIAGSSKKRKQRVN
ncbi:MAG: hypothetical protein ACKO9H_12990 [Planctomycetota bacterium]